MLPYPRELASGAKPPKPNRAGLPKEPWDTVPCSIACWECWNCHHTAQSNLVPPSFLVPEMVVILQSFEVGRQEAERKSRAAQREGGQARGSWGLGHCGSHTTSPSGWLWASDTNVLTLRHDDAQSIVPQAEKMPRMACDCR